MLDTWQNLFFNTQAELNIYAEYLISWVLTWLTCWELYRRSHSLYVLPNRCCFCVTTLLTFELKLSLYPDTLYCGWMKQNRVDLGACSVVSAAHLYISYLTDLGVSLSDIYYQWNRRDNSDSIWLASSTLVATENLFCSITVLLTSVTMICSLLTHEWILFNLSECCKFLAAGWVMSWPLLLASASASGFSFSVLCMSKVDQEC